MIMDHNEIEDVTVDTDRPQPQPLLDEREIPFGAVDPSDISEYAQAAHRRDEEDQEPPVFIRSTGPLTAEYIAVLAEKLGERFDQIESKIDRVLEIVGTQHGTVPAADDEGELIN
jgi:hypothetical protein